MPFVRTPHNYSMDDVSVETGLECKDPTMAQQQFKEETDINTLLERFGIGAQMPENPRVPMFGDFTEVKDFQSAMNSVREAETAFLELPAKVRARFENDPQQLMEFMEFRENREEAARLGLLRSPEAEPTPISVRVVPEPPPKKDGVT